MSTRKQPIQFPELPREVFDFIMKEASPLKKEMFPFWKEVIDVRVGIQEALFRKKLEQLNKRFEDLSERWVNLRSKLLVMENLISPDDPEAIKKIGLIMIHYIPHTERFEQDISRTMQDITVALQQKNTKADVRAALLLSTMAIVVTAISTALSLVL